MDTTPKQQKLSHRAINTILKLSKFIVSRALYFIAGILIAIVISAAYAAWNTKVGPGTPLTSTLWNDMVDKLTELDSRPPQTLSIFGQTLSISSGNSVTIPYCYTYYSTSMSSCNCPSGETNKKDLGSWGCCNASAGTNCLFRPPGLSCPNVCQFASGNVDSGLACVCCKN